MYNAMITENVWQNRIMRKLKLPLKIKTFLCYLNKGVTLTKDNLARRNWTGSKKYSLWAHDESIQHLLFDCHFTKFIWQTVHFTFGIHGPTSINDMFTNWLLSLGRRQRKQLFFYEV
jgi:hypothetical protein